MLPARNPRVMFFMRPSRRDDFEIAIICALKHEYDAVSYIFDEFWDEDGDQYGRAAGDTNHYATGRVGNYNVVLVLLVEMGQTNAATAAASMRSSYRGLRLALLTGVCGSVPHGQYGDIFLGDVIISKTVVQYDFGWHYPTMFVRRNTDEDKLGRPNKDIRSLVATFETDRGLDQLEQRTAHFLNQLQANVGRGRRRGKYNYPGAVKDNLFEPTHRHKHHVSPTCICPNCFNSSDAICDTALISSCADLGCNDKRHIARNRFQATQQLEHDRTGDYPQPAVYVGAVASGDKVIKSAGERDRLTKEAGVIAFETESAGVWDELPCIVVKGVCDYADSHKHEEWQNYAAAAAAAASKAILERYIRTDKP
ncbi:PNP_UDP_1 domain-containing protein [Trichoderma simmonsii]|uniref:PNP_UDP_1 domain-containing protein n=1 Tax=Trichoderma simmonsii TaxID=1491479 RepID=A0A8G0LL97_9HYPO|nr:PNP_UDP_1 domain-containing protein [Trichoderma simmonsii]